MDTARTAWPGGEASTTDFTDGTDGTARHLFTPILPIRASSCPSLRRRCLPVCICGQKSTPPMHTSDSAHPSPSQDKPGAARTQDVNSALRRMWITGYVRWSLGRNRPAVGRRLIGRCVSESSSASCRCALVVKLRSGPIRFTTKAPSHKGRVFRAALAGFFSATLRLRASIP